MATSDHGVDIHGLSDDQLEALRRDVMRENALRHRLGASPEKVKGVIEEYQKAHGSKDGEEWEPTDNPLLRPMEGARRTHDGRLWRSTIDHNVFEPGVSGWVLEAEIDPETGQKIPPPYRRPSGAHDAYKEGDRITWEDGHVYEAVRDGVDWDPDNAPEDWRLVEEETEPEPPEDDEEEPGDEEPVEPDDPGNDDGDQDDGEPDDEEEDEAEPGTIDNPFTWSGDAVQYKTDQYVVDDGILYRVRQGHTSQNGWTPAVAHSLYERQ